MQGDPLTRSLSNPIDERWLYSHTNRSTLLAALWSIVREWARVGQPRADRGKPSFEDWSTTISGMVRQMGLTDPLAPPLLAQGGNEIEEELQRLIVTLAERMQPDSSV